MAIEKNSLLDALLEKGLSRRESVVVYHTCLGLSDNEIAVRLGIKPNTVHAHQAEIRAKLRVTSRVSAVVQALEVLRNYEKLGD